MRCKSTHLGAVCADAGGMASDEAPARTEMSNWASLLTCLCVLVPLLAPHSPPRQHSLPVHTQTLTGCVVIGNSTQVFPRGAGVGRLPGVQLTPCCLFVASKHLLPCPGKAKLILKTNKSRPGLPPVLLCDPPAGRECCGVPARWLWWGSSPLFVPSAGREQGYIRDPCPSTPNAIFRVSLRL